MELLGVLNRRAAKGVLGLLALGGLNVAGLAVAGIPVKAL